MTSPTVLAWRSLATLSCLALIVGCTADRGGEQPTPSDSGSPAASVVPAAQAVDATEELDDVSCRHGDDGWSFDGEITNEGKETKLYTVTVRIAPTSNKKSTIGLTTITKNVAAGATTDFIAKNFSTLGKKGNVCLPIATKA